MQAHEGLLASSSLGPSIPDTAEQGLGPRGGFQLSFIMGWSRGPPEGGEEFLKFCLHFDMGLSRALSSVLILIWDFLLSSVGSVVFLIWDSLLRTFLQFVL